LKEMCVGKSVFLQTSLYVVCSWGQLQFDEAGVGEVCHLAMGVCSTV
jgi:hypothetical protein